MKTRYLKAAALCQSKEGTRYYLKGVAIQPIDGQPGFNIIATDGHRLFAAYDDNKEIIVPDPIIIPSDAIKKALTGYKEDYCTLGQSDGQWYLNDIRFTPIDGQFPDWQRIIPQQISGETATFNPKYLNDFAKAFGFVANTRAQYIVPHVHHNGSSPAIVTHGDQPCFGLLMPMRSEGGNPGFIVDQVVRRQTDLAIAV